MPFVVNGIGTWYYGKRRIHNARQTCEFCSRYTTLESYDTTLFFVVAFIPVLPLGQKRILRQCAACQKHRVLSRSQWEAAKARDCAAVLEQLERDPNDRGALMNAIGLATAYQDEPLFNNVVERLGASQISDASIQFLLGESYGYFARWPEAATAYRRSMEIEDAELVREKLAWALLKQGQPDEARPLLQHIFRNRKAESVGMTYYLVEAFQAQGRHEEALQVMDERDEAFPELAKSDKDYRRQRQTSLRYHGTEKKIHSALLAGGPAGYREGGWTSRLPYLIALTVILGLMALYLGVAYSKGQSRQVFLVNGAQRSYRVKVLGNEYTLKSHSATPIRVPEGDVEVAFSDPGVKAEPIHVHIETNFWSRPFEGHTFVINPDRSAAVTEEEAYYAETNPPPPAPPKVHFGEAFYSLPGVDYEFQPFPQQIQAKKTEKVRKTGVSLQHLTAEERVMMVMGLDPAAQVAVCRQILMIDSSDAVILNWLCHRLPPQEAIAFVEGRLDARPILMDWHRAYQTLMDRAQPDVDLRPRYKKLLDETGGTADALYLLGRADPDIDVRDRLYRQAATADPSSAYAASGLGYRALSEGRFDEAVKWFEQALPGLVDKAIAEHLYNEALLAAGRYDQLVSQYQREANKPDSGFLALMQMVRILAIKGDKEAARQKLSAAVAQFPLQQRTFTQNALQSVISCASGDAAGYLRNSDATPSFVRAFLEGNYKQAESLIDADGTDAAGEHGLLYLACVRSGNKELAEDQWSALLAKLGKGDREERMFADILKGTKPAANNLALRLTFDSSVKRVLLVVLAQRQPAQARELLALAKKLDYQHDAISLCLQKYLPGKKAEK